MDEKPHDWREARRLRAWDLRVEGWLQSDIAKALGVSGGAVSQWMKRGREGGREALYAVPPPGRPCRLSKEDLAELPRILTRGAAAHGFRGDVWTLGRIAKVIKREFGVSYHKDHMSKVMKVIGWSCQKPKRRATQRNEAAIKAWRDERWPEIKRGQRSAATPSSS